MAIRFPTDPKADRAALARKYADAMRDLSRRFPDDLDAATLYAESLMNLRAWKLWSLDGKPAERTEEIVAVLESVLARDPNHLGANHYYIHTVEASPTPARALPSAARLDTLAPAAGHLTHMPAHIYARDRRSRRPRPAPTWRAPKPTASTSRPRRRTASTGWRTTRTTCTSSPTPR